MYMQKRLLEFWMSVSCHVRAGTQSQVLCRGNNGFNC